LAQSDTRSLVLGLAQSDTRSASRSLGVGELLRLHRIAGDLDPLPGAGIPCPHDGE
jgi:hypothetical protein